MKPTRFVKSTAKRWHVADDNNKPICGTRITVTAFDNELVTEYPNEMCIKCTYPGDAPDHIETWSPEIVYMCTECEQEVGDRFWHQHHKLV